MVEVSAFRKKPVSTDPVVGSWLTRAGVPGMFGRCSSRTHSTQRTYTPQTVMGTKKTKENRKEALQKHVQNYNTICVPTAQRFLHIISVQWT